MREILKKSALILACLFVAGLYACRGAGTKVIVRQGFYMPSFSAKNLSAYKGKSVNFTAVTNNANNTSIWNYYSPGSDVYYEATPALQTYFWDCFVKDFHWIGVKTDDATAPTLEIIMNSVTDQEFKFSAVLLGPGKQFRKDYTVTMPPTQEKDIVKLENRGYQLVDAAFVEMVGDADFQKAFLYK